MLAQLFNPTEIKKNGPATRPATVPERRTAVPFSAALAVLPATSQSQGEDRVIVKAHPGDELILERRSERWHRLRPTIRGGLLPWQSHRRPRYRFRAG